MILYIIGAAVLTIEVDLSDKIENVKTNIQDETGIPVQKQILLFNDRILENDRSLQDYNVQIGSTLTLRLVPSPVPRPFVKSIRCVPGCAQSARR